MFRVFFTGAFRKPREINWVIGSVLALLAIIEGFAGYSLPDDLLSGTGLRAMEGFVQTAPVIGSYLAFAIFGGPFPGEMIIPRLYSVHILLIPAILIGLFTAHIGLVFVQKHTQFPGPGRTNENVVGYPVMPVYAAKAGGFFFIVFGVLALMAAAGADQPDLGLRPLRPLPRDRRLPARLVHGLRRRCAAAAARLARGQRLRVHAVAEHRPRRPGAAARGLPGARRLPVRREVGHRRQPRAPPARPAAQQPGAHRHRHGGHHGLLRVLLRRRQRHHGHQAEPVDQRHHLVLPDRPVRAAAASCSG